MGIIKSKHAEWISDDEEVRVIVEHTGRNDEYRNTYEWRVMMGRRNIGNGADIKSGVGAPVDTVDALKAFSSFLEAWTEALRYGGESENRDLFPMSMEQFADDYHTELYMDTHYEEEL